MKRKIMIAIASVLGVFVIFGISLYGYLKSDHAKHMIIQKINTVIPGTVAAENIDFSMFDSNIQLLNVQLKDPKQTQCIKFNSLLVDINIRALFKRQIEVMTVLLKQPKVSISMGADGRINLLDALLPERKEKVEDKEKKRPGQDVPFNVIVKKIDILDGTISLHNPEIQVEISGLNINLTDVNLMAQDLSFSTQFSKSSIKINDKDIRIDNLQLASRIKSGSDVNFTFDLDSNICKINAKGLAENVQKIPEIDLDATIISRLEQLNPFLTDHVSLGGVANLTLSGKGRADDPMISLNLDVTNLKVDEDINNGSAEASVRLEDRIVSIEKGRISLLGNTIAMKGAIDLKNVFPNGFLSSGRPALDLVKYDLEFDQSNQSLKHFEKWIPGISGSSRFSGRIKGHGIAPQTLAAQVRTKVDLKDFKQSAFEADPIDASVEVNATIENNLVTMTALNAKTIETQASVTGQFNIAENLVDATVEVMANDLAAAALPLGITDISGALDTTFQVKGNLSNPEVKIQLSGQGLTAKGIALEGVQFTGRLDTSGKAAIQKLDIQGPHMQMTATGTSQIFEKNFKLKDTIKSNLEVSGTNINPGKFLKDAAWGINTKQLDTLINFKLNMDMDYAMDTSFADIDFSSIDIPAKKIIADIDLGKQSISVVLENIATLRAQLNSKDNQYAAGLRFDHSDFTPLIQSAGIDGLNIKLNGQIDAAGTPPVELTDDVVRALNSSHGTINMDARIRGNLKEPDFNIFMTLADLAYDLDQSGSVISIDSHLELDLDYQPIAARDTEQIHNKKLPLKTITGVIDLEGPDIAMTLDKTIHMNAVCDPETAKYDFDLRFSDTLLDPIFDYAGLPEMSGNLKGHMIAKGNLIQVMPAQVLENLNHVSGKIQLGAEIKGIPTEPISGKLYLKGDQIALDMPDMAQVELSHDLIFYATQDHSDLSGSVLFSKAEYYKDIDIDLTNAISEKTRKTSSDAQQAGTGIPLIDKMTLNVDIDYKDPFTVDNNLAFILIQPDIFITGTPVDPVITGRAKIIDGTIVYQKKEFDINTGIIDFADPYKIDPDINLVANTKIRDWDITLNVSGKTDNLNFQFFSDPQETHEDILSLLITGKTTKELGKGDGSYTNILVDKASDVIGKTVEESTPLDSFKVGYDGDEDSQNSNVSVSMGKKLSQRLKVIYSRETKDEENVQTTAAEYKLMENLKIKVMNDSKGDFGTEFTYKLEFR